MLRHRVYSRAKIAIISIFDPFRLEQPAVGRAHVHEATGSVESIARLGRLREFLRQNSKFDYIRDREAITMSVGLDRAMHDLRSSRCEIDHTPG